MAFTSNLPIQHAVLANSIGDQVSVSLDANDSKYRLEVSGKVQSTPPVAPPAATAITVAAATPLSVSGSHSTDYTITNAKTFIMQQLVCGAEGDPSEKGSKVEVHYVDSGSVEHLVERIYITGFTQYGIYPDTSKARDNTSFTGNGSTTKIRIKRIRMGGSGQEIDVVIRGYEI